MKNQIPLAQYNPLSKYLPQIGDFVVWSGWFTTWSGIVNGFNPDTTDVSIIFAGMPYLLFTLSESEMKKSEKILPLSKITSALHGEFAVLKHDQTRNACIWFI